MAVKKIKSLKGRIDCPNCFSLLQWDSIKDIKVSNGNEYVICPECGQALMLDKKTDYWVEGDGSSSFNFVKVVTNLPKTGDPNYIYAIKYHLYTPYIKDEQMGININGQYDLAVFEKEAPNIYLQVLFWGVLPDYKLYYNFGMGSKGIIDTNYMLDKESIHYVSEPPAELKNKQAFLIDKGQFYKTYTYSSSMGWIATNRKEVTIYFNYPPIEIDKNNQKALYTGDLYTDKNHSSSIDKEGILLNSVKQFLITYIGNNLETEQEFTFYPIDIQYNSTYDIYFHSVLGKQSKGSAQETETMCVLIGTPTY